ncbi:NAD-dependent epimerase/dehydratase family protein [Burkholderia stagnalis]|uniref:NAD-dependent epimerase/dehydratase family protein n=1 Tax=Burkholderia stagnalis TaxID=1503054 RepID=A0ABX9YCF4_9BURK|nr:NAD-dependent epimerase/dehydratase family protein [Burkholderia stagnalis]RQQ45416.1 NAD-dependent epimerase/dehydratase family protein [Burkholderia stagnalis]RQQ62684.1 NAD-dependent epimerase/dehydratase family protein [Burkholderia stagnalis]RQQ63833.1 NAD-dependent epimerase/dehydratase family protein [Burkholderia stagnalis]RQQ76836.1 NAD-dependent epimerase/dehydratase family protein [Burkholderia stagnalis]RQQ83337.1 NAD-dependent epimerase/dehydratase family protein [Burkholderia 
MRIAVSGANGFVGRVVTALLCDRGYDVIALVRRAGTSEARTCECLTGDDNFGGIAAGAPDLGDCDAFIHLAARVHVMRDRVADPLSAFRAVNVDGTLNAARAAVRAGARQFVYVSSIKALGEAGPGRPWREDDRALPIDPYGISKHEAESALRAFGRTHGIGIVIVRPPLVYGAGVGANFLAMMKAVDKGMPLPLAAITARRSLVYVDNLADALLQCAVDPRAAGECFHVADDDAPSVAGLLRMLGDALGKPARLFPVPAGALRLLGKATGRSSAIDRLTGSLQLDTGRIKQVLDWHPPYTTREGLVATAAWYRSRDSRHQATCNSQ